MFLDLVRSHLVLKPLVISLLVIFRTLSNLVDSLLQHCDAKRIRSWRFRGHARVLALKMAKTRTFYDKQCHSIVTS